MPAIPRPLIVRRTVAAGALLAVAALSAIISAGTAASPWLGVRHSDHSFSATGFPDWLSGPFKHLGPSLRLIDLIALTLCMGAAYLVVLALARDIPLRWVVLTIGVSYALLFAGSPVYLSDAMNYLGFARLAASHGLDPYTHSISAAVGDPIVGYASWRRLHSPYGPLFTLASEALAPLSISAGLWVLKGAVAAASLGCVALVARCARQLKRPVVPAVVFVGLNPIMVVYEVGGVHNDAFMLLLILAGISLALEGRERLGAGTVALAAGVKVTGGLILPFLLARSTRRRDALLGVAAGVAAVVGLAVIGFPDAPLRALTAFQTQTVQLSLLSVPGLLAVEVLGLPRVSVTVQHVAELAFVAWTTVFIVRAARGADWLTCAGWATLGLVASVTWLMPWYGIWALPFAALSPSRRLRGATIGFSAFLLVFRANHLFA